MSIETKRGKLTALYMASLLILSALAVPIIGIFPAGKAAAGDSVKPPLRITWFSVGAGDSILIQTPNNHCFLVDGGMPDQGSKVVKKLKENDVKKLDAVISTHCHIDHVGGLPAVFKAYTVKHFYYSQGPAYTDVDAKKLMKAVKKEGCKKTVAKRGLKIKKDGVTLKFVQTKKKYTDIKRANAGSLAIYITYNKRTALLTADNDKFSLGQMEKHKVELMDAPHHGCNNGIVKEFYAFTDPKYVVMSADGVTRNCPNPETFKAIKKYNPNILIYRTDKLGDITAFAADTGWQFNRQGVLVGEYCAKAKKTK